MSAVAQHTLYVAGLAKRAGTAGGDPSPWTARGVHAAMKAAVRHRFGVGLAGVTVAIQGLGSVGYALAELLHADGARLIVADISPSLMARAVNVLGATIVSPDQILEVKCDVLAPCALGGVLNVSTIGLIRAPIICGAANNQLGVAADGERLLRRQILYAPDYVANAGGIINVAAEYFGWDEHAVAQRVTAIGPRMLTLLARATDAEIAPSRMADKLARARILGEGRVERAQLACA